MVVLTLFGRPHEVAAKSCTAGKRSAGVFFVEAGARERWRAKRDGPPLAPALTERMTVKGARRSADLSIVDPPLADVEVGAAQGGELGVGDGMMCWFLSLSLLTRGI